MLSLAKNLLGLLGAILLMVVLGSAAFVLSRSNPDVNIGIFLAVGGVLYTMIILFALTRQ